MKLCEVQFKFQTKLNESWIGDRGLNAHLFCPALWFWKECNQFWYIQCKVFFYSFIKEKMSTRKNKKLYLEVTYYLFTVSYVLVCTLLGFAGFHWRYVAVFFPIKTIMQTEYYIWNIRIVNNLNESCTVFFF